MKEESVDGSPWLSIRQAAERLEVSEQTIFRWMRDGVMTYYKVGDSTRFRPEDLDALVEKHTGTREARRYEETCMACGNKGLAPGAIQSTGRVYFKPEKTRFFTLLESNVNLAARSCPVCGFIHLFADVEKMRKLRKNEGGRMKDEGGRR